VRGDVALCSSVLPSGEHTQAGATFQPLHVLEGFRCWHGYSSRELHPCLSPWVGWGDGLQACIRALRGISCVLTLASTADRNLRSSASQLPAAATTERLRGQCPPLCIIAVLNEANPNCWATQVIQNNQTQSKRIVCDAIIEPDQPSTWKLAG
jgi:hypothetical protein